MSDQRTSEPPEEILVAEVRQWETRARRERLDISLAEPEVLPNELSIVFKIPTRARRCPSPIHW